ncbi:MAG: hypothetical protein ABW179_08730 [Methylobacterium sp.]
MNPARAIKAAYAAFCARLSQTTDTLTQQNDDRLKRLAAYDARYPKGDAKGPAGNDRH